MGQEINSLLTGLATSLNQYMGMSVQSQVDQSKARAKLAGDMQLKEYESNLDLTKGKALNANKAQLDLAKDSALEAFKQTLVGDLDEATASQLHPEAAAAVKSFIEKNGRPPKIGKEADTLLSPFEKAKQNARQDSLDRQRENSAIQKHAYMLEQKKIPVLINTYAKLEKIFNTEANVPGVGLVESKIPNFLNSDKGAEARTTLQQLSNTLLAADSGLAVTDNEYKRFLERIYGGSMPSERDFKIHFAKIGQDLKMQTEGLEAGIDPEYLKTYYDRKGAVRSDSIKTYDPFNMRKAPSEDRKPLGKIFGSK